MPYLPSEGRRETLTYRELPSDYPQDGAELNFVVCDLADRFIKAHGLSYHVLEEVIGALECAKLEITRRIIAPYEAYKAAQNGEVFTHTAPLLAQMTQLLDEAGVQT